MHVCVLTLIEIKINDTKKKVASVSIVGLNLWDDSVAFG